MISHPAHSGMNFKTSDGVTLFYRIDGDGPALMMLSGIWSDTTSWNAQVRDFAEHFTCIRLDHRGIGQSEKWVGEYSYDLHARDAKDLLDHLGLTSASVLGACHGGMAAVTLAKRYPGSVRALCINATQLLGSERFRQMYLGWKRILETSDFETLYTVIMPTIMSDHWLSRNRDRLPSLLQAIEERIEFSAAQRMVDALVAYATSGLTPAEIASIDIPALIMASAEDRFIPPKVIHAECQFWPNATYHLFENSGHFPQREVPETYNSVVFDFLQSLTDSGTLT